MAGCERVKRAAEEASAKVKETAGEASERVGLEVTGHSGFAPELRGLVDYDGNGYRFRRDLEFPSQVSVEETRRTEVSNGRVFSRSALGASSEALKGVFELSAAYRGGVDRLEVTVRKARFGFSLLEGAQTGAEEAKVPELSDLVKALVARDLEGLSTRVVLIGGKWRMAAGGSADFRQVSWSDGLADGVPVLQRMCGVMPRPMWLGEKRYAPGAELALEGDALQLLTGFPARGKLQLEFVRAGDVQGHPCGVFRVKGDFTATAVPRPDGTAEDLEWSVSGGEVWMSLLHPLVLRSDLQAVATFRRHGPQTGPQSWWQGQVREKIERAWKAAG